MTANEIIREAVERRSASEGQEVDIHARAMLVSVSVSWWAARVKDKKVTEEVNTEHSAAKDAGRYYKHLFARNSKLHQEVVSTALAARQILYRRTLPWKDTGWRVLPSAEYMDFAAEVREQIKLLDEKLDEFVTAYWAQVEQAKKDLNGLWNAADYPTPEQVRARFGIRVEYAPLPSRGDFRLDLPKDELEKIAQTVTDSVTAAVTAAMRDAWERLYTVVRHMGERIDARASAEKDPDRKRVPAFHESVIANLVETAEALGRLNVTNDPALEVMRSRVLSDLACFSTEDLKENEADRDLAAKRVNDILTAMGEFYTPEEAT